MFSMEGMEEKEKKEEKHFASAVYKGAKKI